jgi:hypothetical protein
MALVPEKGTVGFQYRKLDPTVDSTRLIAFEPAEDENDTPRCKQIHVTFGETPKYETLSYTWGDEKIKEMIFVDEKEFLVGQNLWDALRVLKKRLDGQRHWIDAICLYLDRYRPKDLRNLRLGPLFSGRFRFVQVGSSGIMMKI